MKTGAWLTVATAVWMMSISGCATGPNQGLGIGAGALGGALLGNVVGGNAASTLGGAAIGGLIGNEVGRNADERKQKPPTGTYPNNGPRY